MIKSKKVKIVIFLILLSICHKSSAQDSSAAIDFDSDEKYSILYQVDDNTVYEILWVRIVGIKSLGEFRFLEVANQNFSRKGKTYIKLESIRSISSMESNRPKAVVEDQRRDY